VVRNSLISTERRLLKHLTISSKDLKLNKEAKPLKLPVSLTRIIRVTVQRTKTLQTSSLRDNLPPVTKGLTLRYRSRKGVRG